MNTYNSYNSYNSNPQQQSSYQQWGNRPGSRRNSLKGYAAPPPPPMPMNMYRNETSRMNQTQTRTTPNQNYAQRGSFIPSDPVRELQHLARRSSEDVGCVKCRNYLQIICFCIILLFFVTGF